MIAFSAQSHGIGLAKPLAGVIGTVRCSIGDRVNTNGGREMKKFEQKPSSRRSE
jgi:hypothetical protein